MNGIEKTNLLKRQNDTKMVKIFINKWKINKYKKKLTHTNINT